MKDERWKIKDEKGVGVGVGVELCDWLSSRINIHTCCYC